MSAADVSAYCAASSGWSLLGSFVLVALAGFTARILSLVIVERVRGTVALPSGVVRVSAMAAGLVFVMAMIRFVPFMVALFATCPAALAATFGDVVLLIIAGVCGIVVASVVGPCFLDASIDSAPDVEDQHSAMVPAAVTRARAGVVLHDLAVKHGHGVTWDQVYELLPGVELFEPLPPVDSERLILRLVADILNAEAVRIGSQRRTTPAEIRQLTNAVSA
jgi:hypothetical protein